MNYHFSLRAVALACILTSTAALAHGEIIKCINEMGSVMLTDQPCESGSLELPAEPARAAPTKVSFNVPAPAPMPVPVALANKVSTRAALTPVVAFDPNGTRRFAPTQSSSVDVNTLKAARSALLAADVSLHRKVLVASLR